MGSETLNHTTDEEVKDEVEQMDLDDSTTSDTETSSEDDDNDTVILPVRLETFILVELNRTGVLCQNIWKQNLIHRKIKIYRMFGD